MRGRAAAALCLLALTGCANGSEIGAVRPAATPVASAPPAPVEAPDARLVFAYYFYWYDSETGGHLQPGILRDHPLPQPAADWRSVAWHSAQLADMRAAGVDVALPVYWGFDRKGDQWSTEGLAPLVEAWRALAGRGLHPPRIGLFFDTTIVERRDLTTDTGKRWFYAGFKDFFSRVPRDAWALVNGRPAVFLFTSDFTAAFDQSTFDYVYSGFQADFGVRPYIVREVSWDYPFSGWSGSQRLRDYQHPIRTENRYLWGAAMHGFVDAGGVAEVGPGFDDRLVPGRRGDVTDRRGGAFYEGAWQAAIAARKPLVAIETWNEYHEGSDVAASLEYGRQYIDLTARETAAFHRG